jgi:hypothetical protein
MVIVPKPEVSDLTCNTFADFDTFDLRRVECPPLPVSDLGNRKILGIHKVHKQWRLSTEEQQWTDPAASVDHMLAPIRIEYLLGMPKDLNGKWQLLSTCELQSVSEKSATISWTGLNGSKHSYTSNAMDVVLKIQQYLSAGLNICQYTSHAHDVESHVERLKAFREKIGYKLEGVPPSAYVNRNASLQVSGMLTAGVTIPCDLLSEYGLFDADRLHVPCSTPFRAAAAFKTRNVVLDIIPFKDLNKLDSTTLPLTRLPDETDEQYAARRQERFSDLLTNIVHGGLVAVVKVETRTIDNELILRRLKRQDERSDDWE